MCFRLLAAPRIDMWIHTLYSTMLSHTHTAAHNTSIIQLLCVSVTELLYRYTKAFIIPFQMDCSKDKHHKNALDHHKYITKGCTSHHQLLPFTNEIVCRSTRYPTRSECMPTQYPAFVVPMLFPLFHRKRQMSSAFRNGRG